MPDRISDGCEQSLRPDRNPQDNQQAPQVPARAQRRPPLRRRNRRDLPDQLKPDEQVNADQVAALVGVEKRTVFRWLAGGHLPGYDLKVGQTCRWKVSTIQRWLAGRTTGRR